MTLLLDTHVFLWLLDDPRRLPARALDAVREPDVTLLLSVASVWEISIKVGLGKLVLPVPPADFVPSRLVRTKTDALPISVEHALAVAELPRHHDDPFDRLLVAQARTEDLVLVSADQVFSAYGVAVLWD